ncbi:MAG: cryptochrome/photolyase family protein, partial [Candidatus Paceibacteria bacterium]
MPSKVVWILGDQLYYWSPFWFDSENADAFQVFIWESPHFFKRRTYHMQKLTYIFSAMRRFAQFLTDQGFDVIYYICNQEEAQR